MLLQTVCKAHKELGVSLLSLRLFGIEVEGVGEGVLAVDAGVDGLLQVSDAFLFFLDLHRGVEGLLDLLFGFVVGDGGFDGLEALFAEEYVDDVVPVQILG